MKKKVKTVQRKSTKVKEGLLYLYLNARQQWQVSNLRTGETKTAPSKEEAYEKLIDKEISENA